MRSFGLQSGSGRATFGSRVFHFIADSWRDRRPARAILVPAALTALAALTPAFSIGMMAMQAPPDDLWPHLIAYVLPLALRDTALLLLGVAFVTLLAGAGTAWLMSSYDFPGRAWLTWLMPMPLAIPTYLSAYVYVDLFEPLGLVHQTLSLWLPMTEAVGLLPDLRSLSGAIAIIGLVLYPYVYLSTRGMFQLRGADCSDAAILLGAGPFTRFCKVTLPMARPALAVGLALVCLETLNDIGASEYLGIRTLTVSIFTVWLNRGSLAGAAQLCVIMLGLVGTLIAIERYGRRNISVDFLGDSPRLLQQSPLTGAKGFLVAIACAIPPLLGFILPLLYLAAEGLRRWPGFTGPLWHAAFHSTMLALIATMIALMLALAVVLAARWHPGPLTRVTTGVAQAGYALPGLVLALGLLAPVLAIDNAFATVAQWTGSSSPGLLLVGSGTALVIAYVIRFLAVPTGFLGAGFEHVPRDYDDTASIANAAASTTLWRVHLPLLQPALIGAAIIVFVDCLKELPATLLLRPLNVETLSTSIYQFASRGSFEAGAPAALLIVVASIGPVAWLTRFADAPRGPA